MGLPSQFRLSDAYLSILDQLAASNGGVRTPALRDAIAYWHRLIADAGEQNAAELSPEDWTRLAHLNDPAPIPGAEDDEDGILAVDWSARLAVELVGMWEGRSVTLPLNRDEAAACRKLAKRIGGWGLVRGYAMFSALRNFWRQQDAPEIWWAADAWMTAKGRGE